MPIDNPSFESPGAQAWLADGWAASFVYSGWLIADFGVDSPQSIETFGNWVSDYRTSTGGINAPFDLVWVPQFIDQPNGLETFAHWRRFRVLFAMSDTTRSLFSGEPIEQFASGWNNDNIQSEFTNPGDEDDFSTWVPSPYLTAITGGTDSTFGTTGGPSTIETFGDIQANIVFVADPDTNALIAADHGLVDEQPVTVLSTGTRPGGLAQNIQYYVVYDTPSQFYLAKTPNGTPVAITDPGTGVHSIRVDPTTHWTTTI